MKRHYLQAEIFTVAGKLKQLAYMPSEVGAQACAAT